LEAYLVAPAEIGARLRRIAEQDVDLGRTEIRWIDRDQYVAGAPAIALLVDAPAVPGDRPPDAIECELHEFAHRMWFAGGEHVVVRRVLLEDHPHTFDIVARMTPVAPRVEASEIEALLEAPLDARDGLSDLARHERLAAPRPLVVEQDAVRGVHPIGFTVVARDPIGVKLRHRIGAARVEP